MIAKETNKPNIQVSPSLARAFDQINLPLQKKLHSTTCSNSKYDVQEYVMQLRNEWVGTHKKEILGWQDISKILGLSKNQVFDLFKRDDFPQQTLGGRKVVTALALSQWLINL